MDLGVLSAEHHAKRGVYRARLRSSCPAASPTSPSKEQARSRVRCSSRPSTQPPPIRCGSPTVTAVDELTTGALIAATRPLPPTPIVNLVTDPERTLSSGTHGVIDQLRGLWAPVSQHEHQRRSP